MRRVLAMVSLMVVLAPARSHAVGGWPTPAAGESKSGDQEIVLTFDDGPNPKTTGRVLDVLRAHKIKAVFFVVGWRMERGDVEKAHALIARMIREGHVVANHTTNHFNLCGVEEATAAAEIDRSEQSIARVAGMPVRWFRAPYGAYCPRLVDQLAARGLDHFHWDIDPQEWRHGSPKRTTAYLTRRMKWSPGRNVILLHDIHVVTVRALPKVLAWLAAENAKRGKAGRPAIRIVDAPALAAEQVAPGLLAWLRETAIESAGMAARLAAAAVP